ncbi:MAG TPA: hypothetical protein PLI18_03330 [Pirellulaceae bacterium]|nr:hypothetical protein [Pirellulaceae bacterium]
MPFLPRSLPKFLRTALPCALALFASVGCERRVNPTVVEWQNRNRTLNEDRARLRAELEQTIVLREAFDAIEAKVVEQEQRLAEQAESMRALEARNLSLQSLVEGLEGEAVAAIEKAGGVIRRDPTSGTVVAVDLSGSLAQDDAALQYLPAFVGLKQLILYGPAIDNDSMEVVSKLAGLEHLDLTRTAVGDPGLAKLVTLKELKHLQLFRCDVTDEGFRSIAQLPKIEQIRCGQTRVSDKALEHIKDLRTVTALDLSDCNQVTSVGVGIIAGFPKLRFLKLWGKQIDDAGILKLAALENLEVVGLNDTAVTNEGMKAFRGKKKLKEIHLVRCTLVGDAGIAELVESQAMEHLDLRDTGISGKALETIGKFPKLRILDLSETLSPGVDDAGLAYLSGLTALEDLNLWHTEVSDAGIAHLASITSLKTLNLDKTKIGDGALETIAKLPNLEWLHIGSNGGITDAGAAKLVDAKKLKYLNITFDLNISDDVLYQLEDALPECKIEGP